jgi:hypothetical protein
VWSFWELCTAVVVGVEGRRGSVSIQGIVRVQSSDAGASSVTRASGMARASYPQAFGGDRPPNPRSL